MTICYFQMLYRHRSRVQTFDEHMQSEVTKMTHRPIFKRNSWTIKLNRKKRRENDECKRKLKVRVCVLYCLTINPLFNLHLCFYFTFHPGRLNENCTGNLRRAEIKKIPFKAIQMSYAAYLSLLSAQHFPFDVVLCLCCQIMYKYMFNIKWKVSMWKSTISINFSTFKCVFPTNFVAPSMAWKFFSLRQGILGK